MIKISSKTNKIRLVGLFCSRDYSHEFELVYFVSVKVDKNFPNVIYRLELFRRKTFL